MGIMGFDMNYKIKVANEVESKEAQELFFQLGFIKGTCSYSRYPKLVVTDKGDSTGAPLGYYLSSECKEVSFAQLRDLVVLKRNLIEDATHENSFFCYIELSDGWYFFDMDVRKWLRSTGGKPEYYEKLKPIEKKEMKEYLIKINGAYKLCNLLEDDVTDEYIEIPEEAHMLTIGIEQRVFWKDNFGWNIDGFNSKEWRENDGFDKYMENYKNTVRILWQRHTHPEELPFIDDKPSLNDQYAEIERVRQSEKVLKEILGSDLPEFDFAESDAWIESNVEQDNVKHSHYKKDISHLDTLDIYRITELFNPHSCGAHIAKKALCSGQRGHKDLLTDIQDIIDTAERWKEMLIEDEKTK